MILRMLASALALALMSAVPAVARPTYARVMCAGTYCTIVNVPDPHDGRSRPIPLTKEGSGGTRTVFRRLSDQIFLQDDDGLTPLASIG